MVAKCGKVERERLMLAFVLMLGAVVFFTLFEQAATSLNLFAERNTDLGLDRRAGHRISAGPRGLPGHPGHADCRRLTPRRAPWWIDMGFDAAQTQSFNAGFILIFAPMFAALWAVLGRRGRNPNPVIKFGLGLAQVGLGFLVIVWSAGPRRRQLPPAAVGAGASSTCSRPPASSASVPWACRKSPSWRRLVLVSTLMAVWFLGASAAEFIAALIAALAGTATAGGQVLDPALALKTSIGVFGTIGWVAIGFGALFLVLAPFIKGWAHAVTDDGHPPQPEPIAPTLDGERQAVNPAAMRADR